MGQCRCGSLAQRRFGRDAPAVAGSGRAFPNPEVEPNGRWFAHTCSRYVGNLRMIHDGFQRAVAAGLDFSSRGSAPAALAAFTEFCTAKVQENPTPWAITAACLQTLPIVPAGHAPLPDEAEWFTHLEFGIDGKEGHRLDEPPCRHPRRPAGLGFSLGQGFHTLPRRRR